MNLKILPLLTTAALLLSGGPGAAANEPLPEEAYRALRTEAANRQRRLIFNNDGNEPVYYCKATTAEELLRLRTAPLAGSHVDAIFYCTWSSGFGMFTHNTKVGQVFNTREEIFKENRTQEFLDKGIDPLQVMVEFGRRHGIEIFWSMRMNDTHDVASAAYGPVMFRANRLKAEHPEYLIGSKEKPPKRGAWTAVDYGRAEVRDLALRYCEEVCAGYDVDGIELDFLRHPFFFKRSGLLQPCGEEELNQMTDLVRRIRQMTEQTGRGKRRPILLAARVPDSVEYCRHIGLDIERWLTEGLLDLLIVSGYAQFNHWDYSVQLARKHGVKVYPSLDESRVRDDAARQLRSTLRAYRGRGLNAWSAGMDGIYLFNFFDPHSPLWRELGDPAVLRKLDRDYFASVRGLGIMHVPHQEFVRLPILNPQNPLALAPGKPVTQEFYLGENFESQAAADRGPSITLRLQLRDLPAEVPSVRLNGTPLANGQLADGWLEFELNRAWLKTGLNAVELSLPAGTETDKAASLTDLSVAVRHVVELPSRGICAHRGAMDTHPENTLAAFREAIRLGAHMIELDVWLSKDKELVVIHDATVDRTTDGKGRVADLTLAELKQLDPGSWKSPAFQGERVPTLGEALAVMPENIWLNVHLKGGAELGEKAARAVAQAGRLRQAFLAAEKPAADAARAVAPAILICNMERQRNSRAYVDETIAMKTAFIQLHGAVKPDYQDFARDLKAGDVRVNYCCADAPPVLRELFEAGVDFILADKVADALNTARELGIAPVKPVFR